jgi:hypothetical protein
MAITLSLDPITIIFISTIDRIRFVRLVVVEMFMPFIDVCVNIGFVMFGGEQTFAENQKGEPAQDEKEGQRQGGRGEPRRHRL